MTILLIERDPATLVAQSLILQCFGYAVLEAGNRDEAWRACIEHRGLVDLIVTDGVLDHDCSSDFVAGLQILHPEIRALFLCDVPPAKWAERPWNWAFLQKPFRADAFADAIRGLDGAKTSAGSTL